MGTNQRVNESEMVIGGLLTLGLDGICALIDLTIAGAAITPFIQGGAVFAIDWWMKSKGGEPLNLGKQFSQYAAGALPILPTTTAVFAARVLVHNNFLSKNTQTV